MVDRRRNRCRRHVRVRGGVVSGMNSPDEILRLQREIDRLRTTNATLRSGLAECLSIYEGTQYRIIERRARQTLKSIMEPMT